MRAGTRSAPEGRALSAIAAHRDRHGQPLDAQVGAVELINVLRPTVAIAHYVTFVGAALHSHPAWRERLWDDDTAVERFVHEVRRISPFFPAAAARVRVPFEFGGTHFPAGRLVLFDLYGTNRDPQRWAEPDRFDPDRFGDWDGSPFDFVPQGGGDHRDGHRCAGEWITIDQMQLAARVLTRDIDYTVPSQDLRVSHRRMPTGPRSGFVIDEVLRRV